MKVKHQKIKSGLKRKKRADMWWGYFFISPLMLGIFVFYIFPFLQSVYFSFNEVNRFNVTHFVGLANYFEIWHNPEIGQAILNTLRYVLIVVPVGICLSLLVAVLLNTKVRFTSLYRTLYFLPAVTMPAAIAMVWKWLFNGKYGLLNQFLGLFGIEGQSWLSEPRYALYMVMIVGIWSAVGYNMILLLAGMQGISKAYYEAAAIDGAKPWKQFLYITLPLLTPTLFFVTLTSIISGFQVFDTIYMMIGKESLAFEATQSMVMVFYQNAFDYGRKGLASAISMIIFAIILVVTIIQIQLQKKWVHYDG